MGFRVLGVDPSHHMVELAKTNGIDTIPEVFSNTTSNKVKKLSGEVDLVCANNVLNHSNEPLDFVRGVNNILKTDGVFVFELPYWLNTIKSGRFDQIYHEHISYFTVKSSYELLRRAGFEIINIDVVDYHGGSLRVYSRKVSNECLTNENKPDVVAEMIRKEEEAGLFDLETYQKYMLEISRKRNNLLKKIYEIKTEGKPIVAVGAAAKGNTFLKFYNLDKSILDYVTDSSPHKQGKYTPVTRIPIVSDDIFSDYDEVFALILSWNISSKLKDQLLSINKNVKFLSL